MDVAEGEMATEPLASCVPAMPLIETEVAFAVVQLSTDVWPAVIVGGVAAKETTVGGGKAALTVTVAFALAVPPGPIAVKVYVVVIVGDTGTFPPAGACTAPIPLIEAEVAFATVQRNSDL